MIVREVVGFPIADPRTRAAAGHPHGEAAWVVIAAMVLVREAAPRGNRPAELAAPNDQRLVKQAAGLKVLDQPPARLVDILALVGYPARQFAVVVPILAWRSSVGAPACSLPWVGALC